MKILISIINKILIKFNYILINVNDHNNDRLVSINRTLSYFKRFTNFLSKQPIIFDVGGHIGQTVQLYNNLFKSSKIFTFEPNKIYFSKLLQLSNKLSTKNNIIIPFEIALGQKREIKKYFSYSRTVLSGFYKLKNLDNNTNKILKTLKIKTMTGDEFCKKEKIKNIDILKINVQGHEPEVLKGFKKMLRGKNIKCIIAEFDYSERYEKTVTISDLESILIPYGYKLFDIPLLRRHQNDKIKIRYGYVLFVNKKIYNQDVY